MNPRMLLPVAMFVGGICAIGVSVATGQADVSLFVIFPVFTGSSWLFVLGTLLVLLSFIAGFVALARGSAEMAARELPADIGGGRTGGAEAPRTSYGGVVFIGPVPIAFGSSRTMALTMLLVGAALFVLLLALILLLA